HYRGRFIYSPLFFLAIIGLIIFYKRSKFWSLCSLFTIAALVIIYGFWPAWWGGGSYGQRFLIPLMPFGAIGIASLIAKIKNQKLKIKNLIIFIIVGAASWSLMLTIMYRFTPVAELRPRSDSVGRMLSGNRYTPIDIINYQVNLINNAHSP